MIFMNKHYEYRACITRQGKHWWQAWL